MVDLRGALSFYLLTLVPCQFYRTTPASLIFCSIGPKKRRMSDTTPPTTMKTSHLSTLLVLLFGPASGTLQAQVIPAADKSAVDSQYEVESRRAVSLRDGSGRKLIIERVKPPVLPVAPPEPVLVPAPIDPAVRAARRAAWALEAKKERRTLSLTGIYYPNGQTWLSWFMRGEDGQWRTYQAWSTQDFRSAWLLREFEVGNTVYSMFPSVHPASKFNVGRNFQGPLQFAEGEPAFRVVGDTPADAKALEPIIALHNIYQREGPLLTAEWLAHGRRRRWRRHGSRPTRHPFRMSWSASGRSAATATPLRPPRSNQPQPQPGEPITHLLKFQLAFRHDFPTPRFLLLPARVFLVKM